MMNTAFNEDLFGITGAALDGHLTNSSCSVKTNN